MTDIPTGPVPPLPASERTVSRRAVVRAGVAGVGLALTAGGVSAAHAEAPAGTLALTPDCRDGDETPDNIEGPFFKRNSPRRTNLVTDGVTGVLLSLTGLVRDRRCRPVAGALLEFWQADALGRYDNRGYRLRGHQFSTADGAFSLETVIPRDYVDGRTHRTPHLHVKVQAARSPVLTTQLFFPDQTQAYGLDFARLNARDRFLDRACTVTLGALAGNRYPGTFEFVVRTAS
jgi:protocatechuate 3,4-dioxygenase beta subunit